MRVANFGIIQGVERNEHKAACDKKRGRLRNKESSGKKSSRFDNQSAIHFIQQRDVLRNVVLHDTSTFHHGAYKYLTAFPALRANWENGNFFKRAG